MTTTNDIDARKLGIPWTEIPKTFQDAVVYCLKLGIEYLWIDALCIIQDDDRDWQQQSAMMARIFQNSYITLAATAAQNDTSGCFSQAVTTTRSHRIMDRSGGATPYFVRKKLEHWNTPHRAGYESEYPLLTRGWVFQERLLSPRLIHFCSNELVWECADETNCECGGLVTGFDIKKQFTLSTARSGEVPGNTKQPEPDPLDVAEQVRNEITVRLLSNRHYVAYGGVMRSRWVSDELLEKAIPRNMEVWHKIVEEYSSLKLSRQTDSLPALSGLAERMPTHAGPYLAGLWTDTIRLDLLWRVDLVHKWSTRASDPKTPSWSWIGVGSSAKYWSREELQGNIFHSRFRPDVRPTATNRADIEHTTYGLDSTFRAVISNSQNCRWGRDYEAKTLDWCLLERASTSMPSIKCTINQTGVNIFGQVRDGLLEVRGSLLQACLQYQTDHVNNERQAPMGHDLPRFNIVLPTGAETWLDFYADYNLSAIDDQTVPDGGTVYLLEVLVDIFLVLVEASDYELYNGWAPRKAPIGPGHTRSVPCCRRIGICKLPRNGSIHTNKDFMKESVVSNIDII